MEHIAIETGIVEKIRNENVEKVWGFYLQDSKVQELFELADFFPEFNDVFVTFINKDFDGLIHNHFYDSTPSLIDTEYWIPELIYIIVSPKEVKAFKNGEEIECALY